MSVEFRMWRTSPAAYGWTVTDGDLGPDRVAENVVWIGTGCAARSTKPLTTVCTWR